MLVLGNKEAVVPFPLSESNQLEDKVNQTCLKNPQLHKYIIASREGIVSESFFPVVK